MTRSHSAWSDAPPHRKSGGHWLAETGESRHALWARGTRRSESDGTGACRVPRRAEPTDDGEYWSIGCVSRTGKAAGRGETPDTGRCTVSSDGPRLPTRKCDVQLIPSQCRHRVYFTPRRWSYGIGRRDRVQRMRARAPAMLQARSSLLAIFLEDFRDFLLKLKTQGFILSPRVQTDGLQRR